MVARLLARGPVLRRARRLPHRHRRLRRHRAAGDDAARARRHPHVLRPPVRAREQSRRSRRVGEAKPNTEVFRLLAARMGFAEECFRDSDEEIARQPFVTATRARTGIDWETLKANGWQRLNVPTPFAPFAQGGFPTPSGKCEFYSESLARQGLDPLPTYTPPRESAVEQSGAGARGTRSRSCRRRRATLSTRRSPTCRASCEQRGRRGSTCIRTMPRARGIGDGDKVRVFNDRGSLALDGARDRQARDRAWSSRCRSGGGSFRPTAATPTRSPRRRSPTWAAPRPSTTPWSKSKQFSTVSPGACGAHASRRRQLVEEFVRFGEGRGADYALVAGRVLQQPVTRRCPATLPRARRARPVNVSRIDFAQTICGRFAVLRRVCPGAAARRARTFRRSVGAAPATARLRYR